MDIDHLITQLLRREGGYVNHPADRGGPTNMGITLKTLAKWRGAPVTVFDVEHLDEREARAIYKHGFWSAPGFSELSVPPVLQEYLFDAAVHHGPVRAKRLLQRAIGVRVDGLIGPQTRERLYATAPMEVGIRFMGARVEYLGKLITRLPAQAAFAHGWMRRINELIPRLLEL